MSITRVWAIGSALVIVIAIVATWFLGIAPRLATIDDAHTQLRGVQQQNAVNQATLQKLITESKGLDGFDKSLSALRASVPDTAQISDFIREVNGAAQQEKVTVGAITVGQAAYYTVPKAASGAAAGADSAGSSSTSSGSGSTGASASAGTDKAGTDGSTASDRTSTATATAPTTDPKITAKNFVTIPISVTVTGSAAGALDFTSDMQHGTRLFLVNKLTTSPGKSDGAKAGQQPTSVQAVLSGYVYVLLRDGTDGTLASVDKLAAAEASASGASHDDTAPAGGETGTADH